MIAYGFLILLFFVTNMYSRYGVDNRNFKNLLVSGSLVLVGVIRASNVGTDVNVYENIFFQDSRYSFGYIISNSRGYIGYELYSKILSLISTNPRIITVVNTMVIQVLFFIFIKRYSKDKFYSLFYYFFLYFYFFTLNGARQAIAVMISLNAMAEFKNKNMVKGYLLILLAISFHSTAVVSLLYPLANYIKWTRRKIIGSSGIMLLMLLSYNSLIELFLNFFPRYTMYFNDGIHSFSETGNGGRLLVSIFYLSIIFIYLYIKKKNEEVSPETVLLLFGVIMGMFFFKNILMSRVELYFTIFIVVLIPDLYNEIKFGFDKWLVFFIRMYIMCISFGIFTAQLIKNINGVLPYKFFWTK